MALAGISFWEMQGILAECTVDNRLISVELLKQISDTGLNSLMPTVLVKYAGHRFNHSTLFGIGNVRSSGP